MHRLRAHLAAKTSTKRLTQIFTRRSTQCVQICGNIFGTKRGSFVRNACKFVVAEFEIWRLFIGGLYPKSVHENE